MMEFRQPSPRPDRPAHLITYIFTHILVPTTIRIHGAQKLFGLFGGYGLEGTAGWMGGIGIPFPMVNTTLAGSAEFFGGLALLPGFGGRLDAQSGGMEYPLTLACVALGLALTGTGRFALSRPAATA